MMRVHLFRIDDVCDGMPNYELVLELIDVLNNAGIKPLLGVVPNCKDLEISKITEFAIEELKEFIKKGKVEIALHGLTHEKLTADGGILKRNNWGEFSGLSYEKQRDRIRAGIELIRERLDVSPHYFFAPAHSYDENTLRVLKEFKMVNVDGISLFPYFQNDVLHIPQQVHSIKDKNALRYPCGVFVFHYHPFSLRKELIHYTSNILEALNPSNFDEIVENINQWFAVKKKCMHFELLFKIQWNVVVLGMKGMRVLRSMKR